MPRARLAWATSSGCASPSPRTARSTTSSSSTRPTRVVVLEVDQQIGGEDMETGPWKPAGHDWQRARRTEKVNGITSAIIQTDDPARLAARWANLLELDVTDDGTLTLDNATIEFVEATDGRGEGLAGLRSRGPSRVSWTSAACTSRSRQRRAPDRVSSAGGAANAAAVQRPLLLALLVLQGGLLGDQSLEALQAAGIERPGRDRRLHRAAGSSSCLQSRNRQWSIRSNTSAKAHSIPRPLLHRLTARTPGVSISHPTSGRRTSSDAVVVCRRAGRRHARRRCAVGTCPAAALISVLLPTPLAPSRAMVRCPRRRRQRPRPPRR